MSKEGKVAARVKVRMPRPNCRNCEQELVQVIYYPPRGKRFSAFHCPLCGQICRRGYGSDGKARVGEIVEVGTNKPNSLTS